MLPFRQPFPCASPSGLVCGVNLDAPSSRQCGDIFTRPIRSAKLVNLSFGEFCFAMFFTSVRGAVLDTIHAIVGTCRPSQMLWIYALSVSAVMGRITHFRRAWPVDNFAHKTMDTGVSRSSSNVRVSAAIKGERPLHAVVRWIAQRLKNEISSFGHSNTLPDFWVLVNRRFCWDF